MAKGAGVLPLMRARTVFGESVKTVCVEDEGDGSIGDGDSAGGRRVAVPDSARGQGRYVCNVV